MPTDAQRREAIGATCGLPAPAARALSPEGFLPLRAPEPGDWLDAHPEPGQTFAQFVASRPNRPTADRRTIYLVRLGPLPASPPLAVLAKHTEAFFGLTVKLLPPLALATLQITERTRGGTRQLLTIDILDRLRRIVPQDAYCLTAVTAIDLYPDPAWNFVFGQASLTDRVGVLSLARYRYPGEAQDVVLRRSAKVLVHEIGHMFGLAHCTYFECVMNGSNHLAEADRRPMFACPVCLHKLLWSVGFDPAQRYRALAAFYRATGMGAEAGFATERLVGMRP